MIVSCKNNLFRIIFAIKQNEVSLFCSNIAEIKILETSLASEWNAVFKNTLKATELCVSLTLSAYSRLLPLKFQQ